MLTAIFNFLLTCYRAERGATAVEYAIMASLIAVVVVGAVAALGIGTNGLFQSAAESMPK